MNFTKEQKEFALKWAEALESGDYTQGRDALAWSYGTGRPEKFCCLGVAADLIDSTKWNDPLPVYGGRVAWSWSNCEHTGVPRAVSRALGWERGREDRDLSPMFIEMNDGQEASFLNIARVIREKYGLPDQAAEEGEE